MFFSLAYLCWYFLSRVRLDYQFLKSNVRYFCIDPSLVLFPPVLRLFALTPLASLHNFLIPLCHFPFNAP